jgi:hypothetical protein
VTPTATYDRRSGAFFTSEQLPNLVALDPVLRAAASSVRPTGDLLQLESMRHRLAV